MDRVKREALEKRIIGGLLTPSVVQDMGDNSMLTYIGDKDFQNISARHVFRKILEYSEDGKELTPDIMLDNEIDADSATYISDACTEGFITGAKLTEYIEELARISDLQFARYYLKQAYTEHDPDKNTDVSTMMSGLTTMMDALVARRNRDVQYTAGQSYLIALKEVDKRRKAGRCPTGLAQLDFDMYGGIPYGELVLIAARPNVGKSILTMLPAIQAAESGKAVLFCSNEMTHDQMSLRMMAHMANVSMLTLEGVQPHSSVDIDAISVTHDKLSKLPIYMLDNCYTIQQIKDAIAQRKRYGQDIKLVVIDLVGKLRMEGQRTNINDYQRLTEISNTLFAMTREYQLTIVGAVQINRAGALEDKPTIADIKGTGAFEEDADKIFVMWGDKNEKDKRYLELAKNRTGRAGMMYPLVLDGMHMQLNEESEG